jgi:60 kDa SS-A/Ro ribonucleoprotein
VNALRGWGRGLRTAVGKWYLEKDADALAYQAVKYQQRDGWSHKDLLRLAHPSTKDAEQDAVLRWMIGGVDALAKREFKRRITTTKARP